MTSLVDTLHCLAPDLPPALVPEDSLASLAEIARRLPPVSMAGLEVRLGGGNDPVDLQVRVGPDREEARLLAAHIQSGVTAGAFPDHPVWRRLTRLCERWADDPMSIPALSELWLELDNDPRATAPRFVPSVFLGLSDTVPLENAFAQTVEVLADLQGHPLPGTTASSLRRCFGACPPGAFVSHVGVMLGRDAPLLRVNLHRVRADEAVACLRATGRPPDEGALPTLLASLYGLVDHVRLCVSVGVGGVHDRLGLEVFFRRPRGLDPRWRMLLDTLSRQGLCDPARADALLEWPGAVTPATARAGWPGHLVVESLTRSEGAFSSFERRLGHLKIDYESGNVVGVKAYLGWVHAWVAAREPDPADRGSAGVSADGGNGTPVAASTRGPAGGRTTPTRSECDDAIRAATGFLLAARSQGGWWRDYTRVNGGSDEWVTAYVGTALARVPDQAAQRAACWAWSLLEARRPEGSGWGYTVPPDTDSTAWALMLAHALGLTQAESARRAEAFVLRHWQPGGGFATYLDGPIRAWAQCGSGESVGGWTQAHVCVTAAAAGVPTVAPRALDWLSRVQQADGHWRGYWWPDPGYTTTLAAEALAHRGLPEDQQRVEAAVRWTLAGTDPAEPSMEHSAFKLAWVVRALLLSRDAQSVRGPVMSAVLWLLENQIEGAWPSSAGFRLPPIERLDPDTEGHGPIHLDDQRLFTTATVMTALHRVQASGILG